MKRASSGKAQVQEPHHQVLAKSSALCKSAQANAWGQQGKGQHAGAHRSPRKTLNQLMDSCQRNRGHQLGWALGGKDLVLGAAARATIILTLAVDEDQSHAPASMASTRAAKGALLTRGKLWTGLQLSASTLWLLSLAQGLLGDATTWLDTLVLDLPAQERIPTSLLAAIAASCPNLRKLRIHAYIHALPGAELFPKLDTLAVPIHPENTDRIINTTAPLVPLTLDRGAGLEVDYKLLPAHMPLLFHPDNIAPLLCKLDLCVTLDDTLLGLLLPCTPALTHLKVRDMQLEHDTHAHATVAWQELRVEGKMQLSSIARLPQAAGMKLIMPMVVLCDAITPPLAAAVSAAISRLDVTFLPGAQARCAVTPARGLPVDEEPAALRVGLGLLRACRMPDLNICTVVLGRWHLSSALILDLSRLPLWGTLELMSLVWEPQPQLYASLLRLLPFTFREVRVHPARAVALTRAHYKSICLGAPVSQAPDAPPFDIKLRCAAEVVEAVQHKVQSLGVFPNVVISHF